MPGTTKIRWREVDRQKIYYTVRQFNAKITRVTKRDPGIAIYQPDRITSQQLFSMIETRQDFNRVVNRFQRYYKRKDSETPVVTPGGVITNQWEVREASIMVRTINRKRTLERRRLGIKEGRGTMGTIEDAQLAPRQFNIETLTPEGWRYFMSSIERQVTSRYTLHGLQRYKQNYLLGFRRMFGSEPMGQEVLSVLRRVPLSDLYEQRFLDPTADIDFIYDENDYYSVLESIYSFWLDYAERKNISM